MPLSLYTETSLEFITASSREADPTIGFNAFGSHPYFILKNLTALLVSHCLQRGILIFFPGFVVVLSRLTTSSIRSHYMKGNQWLPLNLPKAATYIHFRNFRNMKERKRKREGVISSNTFLKSPFWTLILLKSLHCECWYFWCFLRDFLNCFIFFKSPFVGVGGRFSLLCLPDHIHVCLYHLVYYSFPFFN